MGRHLGLRRLAMGPVRGFRVTGRRPEGTAGPAAPPPSPLPCPCPCPRRRRAHEWAAMPAAHCLQLAGCLWLFNYHFSMPILRCWVSWHPLKACVCLCGWVRGVAAVAAGGWGCPWRLLFHERSNSSLTSSEALPPPYPLDPRMHPHMHPTRPPSRSPAHPPPYPPTHPPSRPHPRHPTPTPLLSLLQLPMGCRTFFLFAAVHSAALALTILPCLILSAVLPFCSRPPARRMAVALTLGGCGLLGLAAAHQIAGGWGVTLGPRGRRGGEGRGLGGREAVCVAWSLLHAGGVFG